MKNEREITAQMKIVLVAVLILFAFAIIPVSAKKRRAEEQMLWDGAMLSMLMKRKVLPFPTQEKAWKGNLYTKAVHLARAQTTILL